MAIIDSAVFYIALLCDFLPAEKGAEVMIGINNSYRELSGLEYSLDGVLRAVIHERKLKIVEVGVIFSEGFHFLFSPARINAGSFISS